MSNKPNEPTKPSEPTKPPVTDPRPFRASEPLRPTEPLTPAKPFEPAKPIAEPTITTRPPKPMTPTPAPQPRDFSNLPILPAFTEKEGTDYKWIPKDQLDTPANKGWTPAARHEDNHPDVAWVLVEKTK